MERDTILVPITVLRYFTPVERIDPLYVQVRSPQQVDRVALRVQGIVAGRHRPGANYRVETLTAILTAAKNISLILSLVLVLVSTITLVISGIGIMNIMLVTVTERTREIGVRLAVGASAREILAQFLTEAMMVSLSGGMLGILVGVAIPLSVSLFTDIRIPISLTAIAVAFGVSCMVGLVFGILPANRAAHLNPTEALALRIVWCGEGERADAPGEVCRLGSRHGKLEACATGVWRTARGPDHLDWSAPGDNRAYPQG